MKRAAILLCLLLLTGCGSDAVPAIEEEAWQMTTVQSTADNGAIIACAPGEPGAPDTAERLTLVCTASDGVLTLTDGTNDRQYAGSYRLEQSDAGSAVYTVTVGQTEGMAVTALTRFADRHVVIEKGQVVWTGTSEALSAAPEVRDTYLHV